jgi:hypothetical protein
MATYGDRLDQIDAELAVAYWCRRYQCFDLQVEAVDLVTRGLGRKTRPEPRLFAQQVIHRLQERDRAHRHGTGAEVSSSHWNAMMGLR